MVTITHNSTTVKCKKGENLRKVLLRNNLTPHNRSFFFSCQGIGSCGTCAVEVIRGHAGPVTGMEKWRLRFPPHKSGPHPMRLACQVSVSTDLEIKKWPGLWGEKPSVESQK